MTRQEQIIANLRRLLDERGMKPTTTSRDAGLGHTAIRDILIGKTKTPTDRVLSSIAGAIGVDLTEITNGHPDTGRDARVRGFADDAAPFVVENAASEDMASKTYPLCAAPSARNPAAYAVSRSLPSFALLRGDILILDLARTAKNGDLVVATLANMITGEAKTLIRRYVQPYLIGSEGDENSLLLVDGAKVAILAPVESMIRPSLRLGD